MRLTPKGNNQNEVEISPDVTVLFSYKTPVAAHVTGRGYIKTEKFWSKTTSRHVNSWLEGVTASTVPQAYLDNLCE